MDHASPALPSRDLLATRDFYAGFGFVEHFRDDAWMILRRGTVQLEFFAHPDVDPRSSAFQCTIRVADLDELWDAVVAAGVPVASTGFPRRHEPRMQDWGLRAGYVVDPDGTQLALIEQRD